MPVTLVGSKWESGKLVFYNKATGVQVLVIGPDGINFKAKASASPSVSPSVSPSASPSGG